MERRFLREIHGNNDSTAWVEANEMLAEVMNDKDTLICMEMRFMKTVDR